jgi:hypothetical protein
MDGDGDQDLLSLDPKTSKLSIFLQTSPGRFDPDPVLVGNPPGQPWVILAADIDGDGEQDLVSANVNLGSENLTVFWGGH